MFKSPQQRFAFFNALKTKAAGIPSQQNNMIKDTAPMAPIKPISTLPTTMPMPSPNSPPSESSKINRPMNGLPANPASIAPPPTMNFLKLRRTLKPKV